MGDILFWGSLSFALAVAGVAAFPVNRWLIARGKGHTAVHETGIHGGPPVRGLAVNSGGMMLELARTELPRRRPTSPSFRIVDSGGGPVKSFEVEHEKRMHLIVARRDMTGFQHLHPKMAADGTWSTPLAVPAAGSYRVFADFKRAGKNQTLASDLGVDGTVDWQPLPSESASARTADGYVVRLDAGASRAGREAELKFSVRRGRSTVQVERYLGAGGHLVALREGDLAYLHTHPAGHGAQHGEGNRNSVVFMTEFPSAGRYRLFLQFKHRGEVRTAAFTREVAR